MTSLATQFAKNLNRTNLDEFNFFLTKVLERTEYQYGLRDEYVQPENCPALGESVEYFSPLITADDRMRYIIENIVSCPDLSESNKIGNTTISHFYGARGIHSTVTGIDDPKKAHVDFDRIASGDKTYMETIRVQIETAKKQKKKFYGTTELHTSIQTAARNYCRQKYDDPNRLASNADIIEWIASWVSSGFMDRILNDATSLQKMYHILRSQPGIGEYYGYHCATSNSVNPRLPYQHDEAFCVPGPGAKDTLDFLFPTWQGKRPYGDMVVWLRENQDDFFGNLVFHEFFHNFDVAGSKVFAEDQNTMKVYGTEVSCCQFGVYRHLVKNPHLAAKRQVARNEPDSLKNVVKSPLDELF